MHSFAISKQQNFSRTLWFFCIHFSIVVEIVQCFQCRITDKSLKFWKTVVTKFLFWNNSGVSSVRKEIWGACVFSRSLNFKCENPDTKRKFIFVLCWMHWHIEQQDSKNYLKRVHSGVWYWVWEKYCQKREAIKLDAICYRLIVLVVFLIHICICCVHSVMCILLYGVEIFFCCSLNERSELNKWSI